MIKGIKMNISSLLREKKERLFEKGLKDTVHSGTHLTKKTITLSLFVVYVLFLSSCQGPTDAEIKNSVKPLVKKILFVNSEKLADYIIKINPEILVNDIELPTRTTYLEIDRVALAKSLREKIALVNGKINKETISFDINGILLGERKNNLLERGTSHSSLFAISCNKESLLKKLDPKNVRFRFIVNGRVGVLFYDSGNWAKKNVKKQ